MEGDDPSSNEDLKVLDLSGSVKMLAACRLIASDGNTNATCTSQRQDTKPV